MQPSELSFWIQGHINSGHTAVVSGRRVNEMVKKDENKRKIKERNKWTKKEIGREKKEKEREEKKREKKSQLHKSQARGHR